MSAARTDSLSALLHVCLQDLHAGKRAQAKRLPALADAARDPDLRALIAAEAERAAAQAGRIEGATADPGEGPDNLWMNGVLDDAERDGRSHQPGAILDVALVGALRKAKAAEIVSSETALALARALDLGGIEAVAAANRAEEIASDRALAERLRRLTGPGDR